MNWSGAALHLGSDPAILVFTVGVLLVYVELNRPGTILPGALGLTLALVAAASLLRQHPGAVDLVLLGTAVALLLLDLFRPAPSAVAVAATLALCLGLYRLPATPGRERLHAVTAVICGLILGAGTSVLTRIARRARANKAVD